MLKKIRKNKGFTQAVLAELVGCTPQFISAIENARARPSVDLAKALAKILGVNWVDFFSDDIVFTHEKSYQRYLFPSLPKNNTAAY